MKKFDKLSLAGYAALGALCIVWVAYGWRVVLDGGFYTTPRLSNVTTHVDDPGATFMALIFFSLAAICVALILDRLDAPRSASAITTVAILGVPVVYLIARQI
jgi:hypothetical protein